MYFLNKVAKVIHIDSKGRNNKTRYEKALSEANILKVIKAKYFVPIHKVIFSKNSLVVIMDNLKNGSVSEKIESKKIGIEEAWVYFRQMVNCIEYCHEVLKLCHRDVKPDNFLIDSEGSIRLTDFGLSSFMTNKGYIEFNDNISPSYAPPESRNSAELSLLDGKAYDIHGLGLTLFMMIFGEEPSKVLHGTDLKLVSKLVDLPQIRELEDDLRDLLISLLENDPVKRPQINEIKTNDWLTRNGEYPIPDIYFEAIRVNQETLLNRIKEMNNSY